MSGHTDRIARIMVSFMVRTWNLAENGHTPGDTERFERMLVEARTLAATEPAPAASSPTASEKESSHD